MSTSLLQPTFASGELSPSLAGRVDLARYQSGLRLCRNFWVMAYGGVRNRPGSVFLSSTKGDKKCRLVRFKFNNFDSYALEFTDLLMRVYRDGSLVVNTSGPNVGLPFELVTPFTEAELFEMNFTQSADVMTIVHPAHKPQELKRFANDNWTIGDISLLPALSPPASATATTGGGSGNQQTWRYQVTAVLDDGSVIDESLPVTSNAITAFATVLTASITWPVVAGATYYNVYKDNSGSGVYGFAGRSTTNTFTDNNILATKTDGPPTGLDPFVGAGNYPGAVGYYQQRLVFGGTDLAPQTSWFSKTGAFHNFGYSTPIKDDDAITFAQASLEVNRIMHYLPLRDLLVLTSGSEWVMQGGSTGLTPKTLTSDPQSYNGIGSVPPIVIGNAAIYVQARGAQVSTLAYTLQDDGFGGSDLTVLSSHLFRDYSIVDWAYQKVPDSTVWSVRSDGQLLGLTYLREQEVAAWHQHETDGAFESVCTVPEGREDALYAVVRRQINGVTRRYVERFASRQIPRDANGDIDQTLCYFVDCGLTYNGWNSGAVTMTLSGGSAWAYPETLTLTRSVSGFVPGDPGNTIVFKYLDEDGVEQRLRTRIASYTNGTTVTVEPFGAVPAVLRNTPTTSWGKGVDQLSGLGHLEGKTVAVLADGNVEAPLVVESGGILISTPSVVIHAGLPYQSDLETLSINIAGEETLLDKRKLIPSVSMLVEETRGVFVGPTEADMYELKPRGFEDYDDPVALIEGVVKVNINASWETNGRVFVRQSAPLPISILGIIPEFVAGGKS